MPRERDKAPQSSAASQKSTGGLDFLAELNAPAFEIMRDINTRVFAQMTEAHAAWMRFMQRRIASDMELPTRLAQCKSPQDMVLVYSDFFQTAAKHYQEELAEVTRLGQAFSNETVNVVREKAEEVERRLSIH